MHPLSFLKQWFTDPDGGMSGLRIGVASSIIATLLVTGATAARKTARERVRTLLARAGIGRTATSGGWSEPSLETLKSEARILIIDDESFPHFDRLKGRGFQCEHWKAISREPAAKIDPQFDLVLLDVRGIQDAFGAKDGIQALELLRRDNPWVPIAINTAFPDDATDERRRMVRTLAQHTLSKVIRFAEFEEKVVQLLMKGRSRQYVIDVLTRLSVADPAAVVQAIETAPKKVPSWSFIQGARPSAFQRDQVNRVLEIASSIYSGARWRKRAA